MSFSIITEFSLNKLYKIKVPISFGPVHLEKNEILMFLGTRKNNSFLYFYFLNKNGGILCRGFHKETVNIFLDFFEEL